MSEIPSWVGLQDELLGRGDRVARQRKPVEVHDRYGPSWSKHSERLAGSGQTVKPVPALARGHRVEGGVGHLGSLRGGLAVFDVRAGLGIESRGGFQHGARRVETDDVASPERELTSERPGSRPEIEDALSRQSDAECRKAVKSVGWESGSMACVVVNGAA